MNCAPLDPWDQTFLRSLNPPIKHLSFQCYLRKLTSGVDKGKFVNLEDLSCKVKEGCLDHPPWPAGICTKCQPSAITLSRQVSLASSALSVLLVPSRDQLGELFLSLSPSLSPYLPPDSQPYRHVDNVMFEDHAIVDRFIDGWRKSGRQRMGLLLGYYKEYDEVPLGVQAVVCAIYEPPQVCVMVSLELNSEHL